MGYHPRVRPASSSAARALSVFSVLFALGCNEEAGIERLRPNLQLDDATLDFGGVPVSATARRPLALRNAGTAPLEIQGIDVALPFGVSGTPERLMPGEVVVVEVGFAPRTIGAAAGTLTLSSNDPTRPSLTLAATGEGLTGLLDIRPAEIDVGAVAISARGEARFMITNRGDAPVVGTLVAAHFTRPEHWQLTAPTVAPLPLSLEIEAHGRVAVILDYRPFAAGRDDGRLTFETCGPGCGLEVNVRASAHDASLSLDPPAVDFGDVPLGGRANRMIAVHNTGGQPLTLRAVRALGRDLSAASTIPLPTTLAPGAATFLTVDYAPTTAEELQGEVQLESDLIGGEVLRATAIGRGVGPLVVVQPSHLDFGTQSRPAASQRAVLVVNQGAGPVEIQAASVGGDPSFTLAPDSAVLPARIEGGESVVLTVRYEPTAFGEVNGQLRIQTGAPQQPELLVPVSARYQELQCELVTAPNQVNFGLVQGTGTPIEVAVQNVGNQDCELLAGAFRAPSSPAITVDPLTFPLTIPAGQAARVTFRFQAVAAGTYQALWVATTEDNTELRLPAFGAVGDLCDGGTEPCGCVAGHWQGYRRFDDPSVSSGVVDPATDAPFHIYCVEGECASGQVFVETAPGTYTCSALPSCGAGQGLEWVDEHLSCVDCAVVVRYGFLFGGLRVCAPDPDLACGGGQVPTFLEQERSWSCQATCDNSLYDQVLLDGNLVCVPC